MPHRSTAAYVAALDPIDLAEAAGIDTPAPGSPGVGFLVDVRDAVAEALTLDAVRVDEIAEAVAAAVPIATVTRWEAFVALRLFREDLAAEVLGNTAAGDLTDRVGHALLIFAEHTASALLSGAEEIAPTDAEAAALAAGWQSPGTVGRHLAALASGAPVTAAEVALDVEVLLGEHPDAGDLHRLAVWAEQRGAVEVADAERAEALDVYAEGHAEECERWHRVTCGRCGLSWCDRHDPAPAALCHACNGRGYTLAPWEQQ